MQSLTIKNGLMAHKSVLITL